MHNDTRRTHTRAALIPLRQVIKVPLLCMQKLQKQVDLDAYSNKPVPKPADE